MFLKFFTKMKVQGSPGCYYQNFLKIEFFKNEESRHEIGCKKIF